MVNAGTAAVARARPPCSVAATKKEREDGDRGRPDQPARIPSPPGLRVVRKFAGDGLFTAFSEEPNWGKAHRILLPAFSQRAMRSYFEMMLEVADRLVAEWSRLSGTDGKFMTPAVRDILIRIRMQQTRDEHAGGSDWLNAMIAGGRFRQDVFGFGK